MENNKLDGFEPCEISDIPSKYPYKIACKVSVFTEGTEIFKKTNILTIKDFAGIVNTTPAFFDTFMAGIDFLSGRLAPGDTMAIATHQDIIKMFKQKVNYNNDFVADFLSERKNSVFSIFINLFKETVKNKFNHVALFYKDDVFVGYKDICLFSSFELKTPNLFANSYNIKYDLFCKKI